MLSLSSVAGFVVAVLVITSHVQSVQAQACDGSDPVNQYARATTPDNLRGQPGRGIRSETVYAGEEVFIIDTACTNGQSFYRVETLQNLRRGWFEATKLELAQPVSHEFLRVYGVDCVVTPVMLDVILQAEWPPVTHWMAFEFSDLGDEVAFYYQGDDVTEQVEYAGISQNDEAVYFLGRLWVFQHLGWDEPENWQAVVPCEQLFPADQATLVPPAVVTPPVDLTPQG